MNTSITTSPKPITGAPTAPAPGGAEVKSHAKPKVKADPGDGLDIHSVHALVPTLAKAVDGPTTIPGVRESFPITNLTKITGKGRSGDSFMLDGGALAGMKLQVRRVLDGEQAGFELVFKVASKEQARLLGAMKKRGGKVGPLEFRGADLGDDGIVRLNDKNGSVSEDSSYAPSDMSDNDEWVTTVHDKGGGIVELVHADAAHAARGMVRINLRGDDKTCVKQLKGVLDGLGMQHLFAPPTNNAKDRLRLLQPLWQANHKGAKTILDESPTKTKGTQLTAALKKAGYDAKRVKAMRFADVAPTHFTVVDPAQAEALIERGGRYLYSTVEKIDHVCSILDHGQKSSLRRYAEGQIIDGLSTNEDFCSGGGIGVFTRLVTQNAILDGESWTGRRFKVILKPDVLARTDWFGWPDDKFGQAWGLGDNNFGAPLLTKIDGSGHYQDYNELIFRDAIGPQYIGRVVATTAGDRSAMLEALKKRGFKPVDGTPLEEFVVLAKQFMQYGPAPYDLSDPAAFIKDAIAKAKKGNMTPLRWFLMAGPNEGNARGDLELTLLRGAAKGPRDLVVAQMTKTGTTGMSEAQVDELLTALQKSKKAADTELLDRLMDEPGPALLKTNSDVAATALGKKLGTPKKPGYGYGGYHSPLSVDSDDGLGVLEALAPLQKDGKQSKAFKLALKHSTEYLLEKTDKGFMRLLEQHALVTPADPKAFLKKEIAKLSKSAASLDLRLFLAQMPSSAALGEAQLALVAANNQRALDLLKLTIGKFDAFGCTAAQLSKALGKLPANSKVRAYLLGEQQQALIQLGDTSVNKMLDGYWKSHPYSQQISGDEWFDVLEHMDKAGCSPSAMRWALGHATWSIIDDECDEQGKLAGLLDNKKLFEMTDASKFVAQAAKKMGIKGGRAEATLRLAWLFSAGTKAQKSAAVEALLTVGTDSSETMLEWVARNSPDRKLPVTPAKLKATALALKGKSGKAKAALDWLLRNQSQALLEVADVPLLKLIQKKVEDGYLYELGLDDGRWRKVLQKLDGKKHKGAAETRKWVLEKFGKQALEQGDDKAIPLFRELGLTPKAFGMARSDVVDSIYSIFEERLYDYNDNYHYDDDDEDKPPAGMPEAIKWLISNGADDKHPDDAILKDVFKKLPEWQEDSGESWQPFLDRLDFLPGKYKKTVTALGKKLEDW